MGHIVLNSSGAYSTNYQKNTDQNASKLSEGYDRNRPVCSRTTAYVTTACQ